MNKSLVFVCLLAITTVCLSDEEGYTIKKDQKRSPKITAQTCYELMLSEMFWSSHIITVAGQNQTRMLSHIDNSILQKADYKMLQKIAQEEQEYIKIMEQFAHAQKKHHAFHEEILKELQAKKS